MASHWEGEVKYLESEIHLPEEVIEDHAAGSETILLFKGKCETIRDFEGGLRALDCVICQADPSSTIISLLLVMVVSVVVGMVHGMIVLPGNSLEDNSLVLFHLFGHVSEWVPWLNPLEDVLGEE